MKPLEYLATSFWHEDPNVRAARSIAAGIILADLMKQNRAIFCPVAQCFHIQYLLPFTNDQYVDWSLNILARCQRLLFSNMPGSYKSQGMKREVAFAIEKGIEVEYIDTRHLLNLHDFEGKTLWEACIG